MKKILITGSCGFIFSNFVRKLAYLVNKDNVTYPYNIVSLDKVGNNNLNAMYWNKNHTFYVADILDEHILKTIFELERPDIVVHGAASTFVDSSIENPNLFVLNNVMGTQNIINVCAKSNVEKLIYLSTDEVYGELKSEHDKSWLETDFPNPRNPYSASKYAGELLVRAASHTYGINFNIIRPSNNYGPRQFTEKLIPKTIKCILENKKIPLYGEGAQIRDWTHVFDNCQAILDIIQKGAVNETYNVSANQEFSNLEVVNKICSLMGDKHELISFIKDPRGNCHDFRYSVNTSKIKSLGWKPNFKFNDGIKDTIYWYLNNQWFLK